VTSDISERSIVGIFLSVVHIAMLSDLVDEEPKGNSSENALPHGLGDIVPHLGVESVYLLNALQVVPR